MVMTMPDDRRALLLDLAARCEAAEGLDRELDADLARAVGLLVDISNPIAWTVRDRGEHIAFARPLPRYTESLDAALPGEAITNVYCIDGRWSAANGRRHSGRAKTEPLARRAAALRALAEQEPQT